MVVGTNLEFLKPPPGTWQANLLSALLGAVCVVAFAPFEIYPIAFVSMAGLAYLAKDAKPKAAFMLGFCFGLGMYLFGVSWVYVSLSTYGGMPLWMGSIAVLGFAALMALFAAAATGLSSYLGQVKRLNFLLVLPFSWVVFEWCKSWVLTGFPWLDIAYTQTPSWLFAWAPVGGVYLVSFVVLMISVLLVHFLLTTSARAVIGIALIIGVSFFLESIRWTSPHGDPLNIGVVQANVPINEKWLSENRHRILQQYQELSRQLAANDRLDLLVLPETAIPLYVSQTDESFWRSIAPEGTALLAGLLDHDGENSYNSAVLSCADSRSAPQVYRKRHLVPFGEYQPLKFLFAWVFEYLQLPMSDFSKWQGVQPLSCDDDLNVGLSICYEDAFSNEYRDHLGDASILVNISEDAWFGDSFAPHQRRQLAQMRARELGRPLVRGANSGPSLFLDANGGVQLATSQFDVAVARQKVQAMQGSTPFMMFGSWVVWLSLLVLAAALVLRSTGSRLKKYFNIL